MTKEDLRTKYERIHFEESDNKNGKLKQGYAKWLENELLEAINYTHCCKSDSEQLSCYHCKGTGKNHYDNGTWQACYTCGGSGTR